MRKSLERKLALLEGEYLTLLKAALENCAAGRWGLLGHNGRALEQLGKHAREKLVSAEARALLELGAEIEARRTKLGHAEPFAPHARLMKMRASAGANTPGEPKLAQQWLKEMADPD